MVRSNTRFLIPAAVLCLALGAGVAESGVVTFEYTVEYTGGTPPMGAPPWLRATFSDVGPNKVKLTLETPGLVADEFVSAWLFNVDPAFDPIGLVVTHTGGVTPEDVDADENKVNPGGFDLAILFPTRNNVPGRFLGGLSSEFLIEWFGGGPLGPAPLSPEPLLVAESFSFTASKEPDLFTSAHVQAIGVGKNSGWVTPGQPETPVPEPGMLVLVGSGLLGLAARRRRARP